MANPQKENGYLRIANELLEAFAKIKIGGKKRQITDFIIRKTYGFNKKTDKISLTQFSKGTGMVIRDVCRCINQLTTMKIILKIQDSKGNIYGINKDYDQWVDLSVVKNVSCKKCESGTDKNDNQVLTKMTHTKDNIQKTILQKTYNSEQSSQQRVLSGIEQVIDIFYKSVNPTINWGNRTTRKAAADLIKKFGLEDTLRMARAVVAVQGKPYSPVATTPYQMKEKLAQFKIYFDKEKNNQPKIIKA